MFCVAFVLLCSDPPILFFSLAEWEDSRGEQLCGHSAMRHPWLLFRHHPGLKCMLPCHIHAYLYDETTRLLVINHRIFHVLLPVKSSVCFCFRLPVFLGCSSWNNPISAAITLFCSPASRHDCLPCQTLVWWTWATNAWFFSTFSHTQPTLWTPLKKVQQLEVFTMSGQ